MAGGIDWFRWHHGSVTDPKFQLVAKKAGASVAEVVAMWACLLESASQAAQRGTAGPPDFEALDCHLGLSEGKAKVIYARMAERALIDGDGQIVAWEKRQPKREREDDKSTDRVQAFRERQRQSEEGNATKRHETPREEESREEEIKNPTGSLLACASGSKSSAKPKASKRVPAEFVVTDELKAWADENVPLVNWQRETESFRDWEFKDPRSDWPAAWRRWMRKAHEDAAPAGRQRNGSVETVYQQSQRERVAEFAPRLAKGLPTLESIDVLAIASR